MPELRLTAGIEASANCETSFVESVSFSEFCRGNQHADNDSLHPESSPLPRIPHCRICFPMVRDNCTMDARISLCRPFIPPGTNSHFRSVSKPRKADPISYTPNALRKRLFPYSSASNKLYHCFVKCGHVRGLAIADPITVPNDLFVYPFSPGVPYVVLNRVVAGKRSTID